MKRIYLAALISMACAAPLAAASAASDCPAGGTIHFGVEPYESNAILLPIYTKIADQISKAVGCPVELQITTSYNAEVEAMRNGKLEIGEFGPLGYVLAHQVGDAQAVAAFANSKGEPSTYTASVVTWPGSGITSLTQVAGHTFAYSDPASTSGHLFPAYALQTARIDPNSGVKPIFAGSHTASYEALVNHKVEAGELNSQTIQAAQIHNNWDPKAFVTLWRSKPIPLDPICVWGKLKPALKTKLTDALQHLKLDNLTPDEMKVVGTSSGELVPQTNSAYDQIRSLVHVLHIDLSKMNG